MTARLTNAQIAWRAAQDLPDGAYVNLGIGFPEMIAKFKPKGREAVYHTENGILDFGEAPPVGEEDWDLINAGKKAVTLNPGAAFFHHAEVAENGNLANWSTGPGSVPAVGGAMDLVHGAKQVWVVTDHVTKKGEPKLVKQCSLPLTGVGCVTTVYTSLAVIDIVDQRFMLREKLPDMSLEDLQSLTGAELVVGDRIVDLVVPEI
jgi:3-oxoadipate CoA-transferase beta subunit